jgi:predicted nucleic acid-binding protein
MPAPVILDNTVLTNLALVGAIDLVFHLWPDRAVTTAAVLQEYRAAADIGLLPAHAWADLIVVEMTSQEETLASTFSSRLGVGERSCLAVAHSRGGLLVSDDADARDVAKRLGVVVSGTLGVLVLAVRRSLLTLAEANELLGDMIDAGYRSPMTRLDNLV